MILRPEVQGQQGGYLIDQHGRFVYYAIHVNPEFLQFLKNQNLTTLAGIEVLSDPNNQTLPIDKDPRQLTFLGTDSDIKTGYNTNVVEYKSAWMIVDGKHPPSNYFVVPAFVPHYVIKNDALIQDIVDVKPVFEPKNPDHGEDSEVIAVNNHVTEMFREAKDKGLIENSDQRRNYRLVGVIWLDQPILGNHTFKPAFARLTALLRLRLGP
ncbi:MAG TPA: hypothetical protein VFE60_27310 [Roseiarcus sp.]|jgi:hypothetical protein|nr:hypothetical protein [Roseiarcus sp.]